MPVSDHLLNSRQFDGKQPSRAKSPQFDAAPLVERFLNLVNRSGEQRWVSGFVPLGVDKVDEVRILLAQNGGTAIVEQGTGDLSEFTWIKSITLSDGFSVADWLQIRNRDGQFGYGQLKDGRSFWENGNTLKVTREGVTMITEDYGMKIDLPTPELFMRSAKAAGGFHSDVSKESLEAAKEVALYNLERDSYSVNPDTGQVIKEFAQRAEDKFVFFDTINVTCISHNELYVPRNDESSFGPGMLTAMLLTSQNYSEGFQNSGFPLFCTPTTASNSVSQKNETSTIDTQSLKTCTPEELMLLRFGSKERQILLTDSLTSDEKRRLLDACEAHKGLVPINSIKNNGQFHKKAGTTPNIQQKFESGKPQLSKTELPKVVFDPSFWGVSTSRSDGKTQNGPNDDKDDKSPPKTMRPKIPRAKIKDIKSRLSTKTIQSVLSKKAKTKTVDKGNANRLKVVKLCTHALAISDLYCKKPKAAKKPNALLAGQDSLTKNKRGTSKRWRSFTQKKTIRQAEKNHKKITEKRRVPSVQNTSKSTDKKVKAKKELPPYFFRQMLGLASTRKRRKNKPISGTARG